MKRVKDTLKSPRKARTLRSPPGRSLPATLLRNVAKSQLRGERMKLSLSSDWQMRLVNERPRYKHASLSRKQNTSPCCFWKQRWMALRLCRSNREFERTWHCLLRSCKWTDRPVFWREVTEKTCCPEKEGLPLRPPLVPSVRVHRVGVNYLVSWLVSAFSPVNHRGLHLGWRVGETSKPRPASFAIFGLNVPNQGMKSEAGSSLCLR